jgi:hypothetical protein
MLALAMPQSEPVADRKRSTACRSRVKIDDESSCGVLGFGAASRY